MVTTLPIQTIGVSMAGSFHGFHKVLWRDSPNWGDMEHRPEEPLGESIADEQDMSNGTSGIGCEFTNAGTTVPYDPENEDEIHHRHGHHAGYHKESSCHPVQYGKFHF